jgi:MscS family membrane protein
MVLGERLLAALVVILAILATLGIVGFNLTTVLAGLGIGGIAIAFAAQKTLENLFGGISVLGDEVIRVGDYCRFGDRTGTVEDISLRSTRIRTDARTEVSIPNGALATMSIENFSRRDKILFNPPLAIRCETSADQLRYLLAEIRRMLYEHPKVESESAGIRFANFDNSALRLEIFSYVLTQSADEFNAIREDLLLRSWISSKNRAAVSHFPHRPYTSRAIPASTRRKPAPPNNRSSNGGTNTSCHSPILPLPTNQPSAIRLSILRRSRPSGKTGRFPETMESSPLTLVTCGFRRRFLAWDSYAPCPTVVAG